MDRTVLPASSTERPADVSQPISVEAIRMQLEQILARRPVGPARDVHHFHSVARRSLFKVNSGYLGMSLTRDQFVFSMGEITGNIWMAEFGSGHRPDR
jgi:hypothetical protein